MDANLNGVKVPIIEPHVDQKLIITFTKNEQGNEIVQFDFDPPIPEVRRPAQAAAANVANIVLREITLQRDNFLAQEEAKNGKSTEAKSGD